VNIEQGVAAGRALSPLRSNALALYRQGWPVFIGQIAVLGFSTIDTLLLARYGAADLAAFAIGSAAFMLCFIGLMGVLMAIGPIVGRLFGAQELHAAGRQLHQAVWVAMATSLIGCGLLLMPAPFLHLAQAKPELATPVAQFMMLLACSLPASMALALFRGFNNAVSRPKAVMVIQLGGLAAKLPLSALLIWGWPAAGLAPMGVLGAGLATAICMWLQALVAWQLLRRDPFYQRFAIFGRGLDRPDPKALKQHLKLGIPMGGSILAEVAGFVLMAFFIARLGTNAVAGHQIVMNYASLIFMLPIALASAGTTLVAQRIGAGSLDSARQLTRDVLRIALILSALVGLMSSLLRAPLVGLYTGDFAIAAVALPILLWFWLFHVADALQIVSAFVLRAYHVTFASLLIYVAALWGLGLGGGYLLAFNVPGGVPPAFQGTMGFWSAAIVGVSIAALALAALLLRVSARYRLAAAAPGPA
jgi:multidrug resistance protein, MATE family